MKILVAPNSFKECADSVRIADIMQKECRRQFQKYTVLTQPVSDGGDGFLKVVNSTRKLKLFRCRIPDCYNRLQIMVPYGYDAIEKTVYLESADIFGMKTVFGQKKEIQIASSVGLGIILKKIAHKLGVINIQKIVIGLGGSAINDFGIGVLYELGGEIFERGKHPSPYIPENFGNILNLSKAETVFPIPIEIVTDVQIPLFGSKGCSRLFAKQKGANSSQIQFMDEQGKRLARMLAGQIPEKIKSINGACGGVALGMHACAMVSDVPASTFLMKHLHLEEQVQAADVILTGEGRFDDQSLLQKATGLVIEIAQRHHKPVMLICGSADASLQKRMKGIVQIIELERFFESKSEAMHNVKKGIRMAVQSMNL